MRYEDFSSECLARFKLVYNKYRLPEDYFRSIFNAYLQYCMIHNRYVDVNYFNIYLSKRNSGFNQYMLSL